MSACSIAQNEKSPDLNLRPGLNFFSNQDQLLGSLLATNQYNAQVIDL